MKDGCFYEQSMLMMSQFTRYYHVVMEGEKNQVFETSIPFVFLFDNFFENNNKIQIRVISNDQFDE